MLYVCVCVCVYVYIYIYIHTHRYTYLYTYMTEQIMQICEKVEIFAKVQYSNLKCICYVSSLLLYH